MTQEGAEERTVLRVLFVCTGNTCRSPMAETLFRSAAAEHLMCSPWQLRDYGVDVFSAGVAAWGNSPASAEAVGVMERCGLDLSQHLSRQVTPEMIAQSNVVLALTQRHRDMLLQLSPRDAERIFLLSTDGTDIADPIGGSAWEYQQCADEISGHIQEWVRKLLSKKVE